MLMNILSLPDEISVKIAKSSDLSTIISLAHINLHLNKLITTNCGNIGFSRMYNNALVVGNEYVIKLLYFVTEIDIVMNNQLAISRLYNSLVKSGNLEMVKWFCSKNRTFLTNDTDSRYIFDIRNAEDNYNYRCDYDYVNRIDDSSDGDETASSSSSDEEDYDAYEYYSRTQHNQIIHCDADKEPCNKYGVTLLSLAAWYGHLHIIQWLIEICECSWNKNICSKAARRGNVEILDWAFRNGHHWANTDICLDIAMGGNLDWLKFAVKKGCSINLNVCYEAARNNHLHMLQWLSSNMPKSMDSRVCQAAAHGGNLEILKWLKKKGCKWDAHTCQMAVCGNHLEVLQWAIDNGCKLDKKTSRAAAFWIRFDLLKLIRSSGCPWSKNVTREAILNCDIEMLKWSIDNGCVLDYETFTAKYEENSMWQYRKSSLLHDTLNYCLNKGCIWDQHTSKIVAKAGLLDIFERYLENGHPIDKNICNYAAKSGNISLLEYCRKHGYGWDSVTLKKAVSSDNLTLIKYCIENGCPSDSSACATAAMLGNLSVLKYLREVGHCAWDKTTSEMAIKGYYLKMLKWCMDNNCPTEAVVVQLYNIYLNGSDVGLNDVIKN